MMTLSNTTHFQFNLEAEYHIASKEPAARSGDSDSDDKESNKGR